MKASSLAARNVLKESLTDIFHHPFELSHLKNHHSNKSRKILFLCRFKPQQGYIFDPKYKITSFKNYVSEKIKQSGIMNAGNDHRAACPS